MDNLDSKLDQYKSRLLDMSMKNPLLNYHDTKSSTLRIDSPDILTLWKNLVQGITTKLTFPFPVDLIKEEEEEEESLLESDDASSVDTSARVVRSVNPDSVLVDKELSDQQRVLRNLKSKAKRSIDELGINTLYLSFGFLRWHAPNEAATSNLAPLVLVPVTLSCDSIRDPFVLALHDDEAVLNPTLAEKLHRDFGIDLPSFDMDISLESYFSDIERAVRSMGWSVERRTALSILSYQKLSMYKDLERRDARIRENPVIKALCGDGSCLTAPPNDIDSFSHDTVNPEDCFEVVDADSSQQDAIRLERLGLSFRLQGPPGTGKSQTITNIIADCLAQGKKVLFVSEKKAALDVVYRRLQEASLDEFCLVLHGTRAHRSDMLKQLQQSVNLSEKHAELKDTVNHKLEKLTSDRDKLNEYAAEIYELVAPLNESIFDVNGHLVRVEDAPDLSFAVTWDIRNLTVEKLDACKAAVSDLVLAQKKLSANPSECIWSGASAKRLRQESNGAIESRLRATHDVTNNLVAVLSELSQRAGEPIVVSPAQIDDFEQVLRLACRKPDIPSSWVVDADLDKLNTRRLFWSKQSSEIRKKEQEAESRIAAASASGFLAHSLPCENAAVSSSEARELSAALQACLDDDQCYKKWQSMTTEEIKRRLEKIKKLTSDYLTAESNILGSYDRGVLSIDVLSMRDRFVNEYGSGLKRLFSHGYKNDMRELRKYRKTIDTGGFDYEEALKALDELMAFRSASSELDDAGPELEMSFPGLYTGADTDVSSIESHLSVYENLNAAKELVGSIDSSLQEYEAAAPDLSHVFGGLFSGLNSDWNGTILAGINWATEYQAAIKDGKYSSSGWALKLVDGTVGEEVLRNAATHFDQTKAAASDNLDWFLVLFENDKDMARQPFNVLSERALSCSNDLASLENWIAYEGIVEECEELGIGDFVERAEASRVSPELLLKSFEKRICTLWLEAVLPEYPEVSQFKYISETRLVDEFNKLDYQQFVISQQRIRSRLINTLPAMHSYGVPDERNTLLSELNKQRRYMPTRKLFSAIPNLLVRLKPCLMMSPLSVSMFLESEGFVFDTVVFDEASQVRTEDAIGAISRGKQVIIAGDSKQLPPTSFFDATSDGLPGDEDSDDYYSNSKGFDSVLDEAFLLPDVKLRWHYRSKDESLIAFSNDRIYSNSLVTFPSPTNDAEESGVEFVPVPDGVYLGSRRGNPVEAEVVADLVYKHFERYHGERSLGVIALSQNQQAVIESALRRRRLSDSRFEGFFSEENPEPLFIKNLESVQGDERDTIILSIGYGKDQNGKINMNFGPINREGGERRLNVAVTRAKMNMKVVSSMMPTDIQVENLANNGPRLLRSYLEYAKNGPVILEASAAENPTVANRSLFEKSVYDFLVSNGFDVATRVGCSEYRIDLAVRHPQNPGCFALGIECDGAAYHLSRTARDRDRLRQEVLRHMNWNLYRVWSTDWVQRPKAARDELLRVVNEAIESDASKDSSDLQNGT